MNLKHKIILIIYTICLLAGGSLGYIKTGSLMSLVASVSFSFILLTLLAANKKIKANVVYVSLVLLLIDLIFTYRYFQSFKFFPAGAFAIITFITLILFIKVSDRPQNKAPRGP